MHLDIASMTSKTSKIKFRAKKDERLFPHYSINPLQVH